MALWDGPLFVGPNTFPVDANTSASNIYQIQTGGAALIHNELQMSHQISFFDGQYWSADGKAYIVGGDREPIPNYQHGVIWTWDGTSLSVDHTFPASVFKDNFTCSVITEFNGALYVGVFDVPAGTPNGGRIFRKSSPGGAWTEVHNYLGPNATGPSFLHESQGQLFVTYGSLGAFPHPASFYFSPTGDLGSWLPEPWIGAPTGEPAHIFWSGAEWVYTEKDTFGFTLSTYFAPVLGGPWGGPTVVPFMSDCGRPYKGPAGNWYLMMDNTPNVFVYGGAGNWVIWRVEAFNIQAKLYGSPCDGGVWDGDIYTPMFAPGTQSYAVNLSPSILFPDFTWFNPAAFIPTPTGPPAWDIVDVSPPDWGSGPFCDETTSGNVVINAGSDVEIIGDQGLDTPSYYQMEFGPTCPDLPDDWDFQLDLVLTSLPRLKDDNGTRITIWIHDTDLSRKTMIGLSKQGISIYRMEPYSDPVLGSQIAFDDGDEVTLKLTGLGSDPHNRSYLSIEGSLIYKRGFSNFYEVGSVSTLRIEAVGSPDIPAIVKARGIRGRTHSFAQGDTLSIDNTKPEAVIT